MTASFVSWSTPKGEMFPKRHLFKRYGKKLEHASSSLGFCLGLVHMLCKMFPVLYIFSPIWTGMCSICVQVVYSLCPICIQIVSGLCPSCARCVQFVSSFVSRWCPICGQVVSNLCPVLLNYRKLGTNWTQTENIV